MEFFYWMKVLKTYVRRHEWWVCFLAITGWFGPVRECKNAFTHHSDQTFVVIVAFSNHLHLPINCIPRWAEYHRMCWIHLVLSWQVIGRPPHGVSRQWAVVVRYGMRCATGASLSSWFLKAAGLSCSTTTAGNWFQSPTIWLQMNCEAQMKIPLLP